MSHTNFPQLSFAYNTATQNIPAIPSGTVYSMNQTQSFITGSMVDLAGNKFTLLGDGWYRVLFWAEVNPFSGTLYAVLTENPTTGWGSGTIRAVDWEVGSNFFSTRVQLEGVYEFSAGDEIQIHLSVLNPNKTVTIYAHSGYQNGLFVERLT